MPRHALPTHIVIWSLLWTYNNCGSKEVTLWRDSLTHDSLKTIAALILITWLAIVSQLPARTPDDKKLVINGVVLHPWMPLVALSGPYRKSRVQNFIFFCWTNVRHHEEERCEVKHHISKNTFIFHFFPPF
jgi:hypothetical protein